MKTVELFCGTKSFTKVAARRGYGTFTLDSDPRHDADVTCDILTWHPPKELFGADVLWASPPCTGFSVASIGRHWGGGYRAYEPKTETARLGMRLVDRTLRIIKETKPKYWFIENPRGVLRKLPMMDLKALSKRMGEPVYRHTVTYCQYGDDRMKPTDIWTNVPPEKWTPKPACKNGDPCHEAAPRGSKTGTQGRSGAVDRGAIPARLFTEILKAV